MAPPMSDFAATISEAYSTEGAAIDLGRGVHDGLLVNDVVIQVPLRMLNRHGLIAGATGTGKTISLQTISEQLSDAGVIGPGVPVRATVSDFGHQLLAKVLEANETQEQSLALVFHYADQKGLPLVDLTDLRALLTFLESDAGESELEGIGGLASSPAGVLLRSLIGLETGGGTEFFGEPQQKKVMRGVFGMQKKSL